MMAAHDFLQRIQAAHPGHLQIESDHLRFQFGNFLEAEVSVHGGADHLDRRVGLQNLRNQLAHQRGIVHHQHTHGVRHRALSPRAWAGCSRSACKSSRPPWPVPLLRVLLERSTTAARFRISTTRPSPRSDAPLTKSVATVWSSTALITNSSSLSNPSTISPSLRSPRVMTRTKILVREFLDRSSCGLPRRTRGKTCPRNCSTSQLSTWCTSPSVAREISATAFSGMAYSRFSTRNNRALMMASVRGSFRQNVVPWPACVKTSTVPFSRCITLCTTSRPTPRPEISVISWAVLNPGWKTSSKMALSLSP